MKARRRGRRARGAARCCGVSGPTTPYAPSRCGACARGNHRSSSSDHAHRRRLFTDPRAYRRSPRRGCSPQMDHCAVCALSTSRRSRQTGSGSGVCRPLKHRPLEQHTPPNFLPHPPLPRHPLSPAATRLEVLLDECTAARSPGASAGASVVSLVPG